MKFLRNNLLKSLFFVSLGAIGHKGGHGPLVEGKGPNGGLLASVINAKEIKAGAAAEQVFVAESTPLDERRLQVRILAKDKSSPVLDLSPTSKIIAITGKKKTKPDILKAAFNNGAYDISLDKPLKEYKMIEVIFIKNKQKFVTVFDVN